MKSNDNFCILDALDLYFIFDRILLLLFLIELL